MKIINNDAYQAYNKLINGYDAKNIELGFDATVNAQLVSGAIGLATCGADNPFEPGTREAHLYYRIGYCYSMWRRNGIDAKVNRIRMLRAAVELAEMNIENPFEYEVEPVIEPSEDVVSQEELADIELAKALAEDIDSGTFVPLRDVEKIFGVLPEDTIVEEG